MYQLNIVIVEDDPRISELLLFNLQNNDYEPHLFQDGLSMLEQLPQLMPVSLFIIDIMLPGPDGFEICRKLKGDPLTGAIPVILLTARGAEADKVRGLTIGADDYMTKPFGIREFLARVEAVLRRYGRTRVEPDADAALSAQRKPDILFGPIRIDELRHRVFVNNQAIEMTNREYTLLKYLVQHPGIAFSREQLLQTVWGYNDDDDRSDTRTVDIHIHQVRRKIEAGEPGRVLIETLRGYGYRMVDSCQPDEAPHARDAGQSGFCPT